MIISSSQRRGSVALLLALVAGASAPLAAGLPLLLTPRPPVEVRRTVLECAHHPDRTSPDRAAERHGSGLARCALVRRS